MFDFDRLYQLSKACGVSKSHLCSLAGKNASYIADLRRLHREPLPQVVSAWADALHTTPAYLMGETDDPEIKKEPATGEGDGLTAKDRRDIARDLEKLMDELENSGDLMFDGDPLTEEATESIRNAMAMALEYAKKVNKEKYTPKKYRKEKGE